MNHKRVSVIIPAAGNATRMNGIHKTMYRLAGVPVLTSYAESFSEHRLRGGDYCRSEAGRYRGDPPIDRPLSV